MYSACWAGLQECNERLASEKQAHFAKIQAHLASSQLATTLQTELEALQQELADRTQSCTTATEMAAFLQAELEMTEGTASSLEGQLGAALQKLTAEQHRHQAATQSPCCNLQARIEGFLVLVGVCLSERQIRHQPTGNYAFVEVRALHV